MWARCPENHRWLWSRGSHAAKYRFLDGIQSLSALGVLSSALSFSSIQDRYIVCKANTPGRLYSSTRAGQSRGFNNLGLLELEVEPLCACVSACECVCVHMYVAAILLASFWSCLTTSPAVQMDWAQCLLFISQHRQVSLSRVFLVCVTVHCHVFSLYVSWPLCHNTAPTSRSHSNWKVIREISSVQQRGLCLSFLELRVSKMTLDTKELLIPVIINSSNHSSRFTEIQDKQHNGVSRPPWW